MNQCVLIHEAVTKCLLVEPKHADLLTQKSNTVPHPEPVQPTLQLLNL